MTKDHAEETDRVRRNTSDAQLQKIDDQIKESVRYYSTRPREEISQRIHHLETEWSMERWLETNASALAFTGVALGITRSRKWLALPLLVTGFLFQHAVQGWCPPVPVLRKFGVRTRAEIDREKYALKILRGDFVKAAKAIARYDGQSE
ncbi:MAG TPA: hypothetical protein VFV81_05390, partial [Verrucomicrobiae bacterium]|nr:hypothetical protein [Verrucomicrobiae bacterium]